MLCAQIYHANLFVSGPKYCKRGLCGRGECVLTSVPPYYECRCKEPFQPPDCKTCEWYKKSLGTMNNLPLTEHMKSPRITSASMDGWHLWTTETNSSHIKWEILELISSSLKCFLVWPPHHSDTSPQRISLPLQRFLFIFIFSFPDSVCEPNPCKNGGTCVRAGNDFDCQCAPGYGGSFCHVGKYNTAVMLLSHALAHTTVIIMGMVSF